MLGEHDFKTAIIRLGNNPESRLELDTKPTIKFQSNCIFFPICGILNLYPINRIFICQKREQDLLVIMATSRNTGIILALFLLLFFKEYGIGCVRIADIITEIIVKTRIEYTATFFSFAYIV